MSLKLKIAVNTLVQFIGKAISAVSTLGIIILIAREFGVAGFGEYSKILSYTTLFYLAVDFGLNAVVLLREKETADPHLFANLFAIRLLLAAVWIFIALALLFFLPFNPLTGNGFTPLSKLGIIIMLPTILTQAVFVTSNAWFQRQLRYDRSVIAASVGSIVSLSLIYLFTRLHVPLLVTLFAYLTGSSLMAGIAFYLAGWRRFVGGWSISSWRSLLLEALPLGLTLVLNLVYFRADILILTIFRATSEVGLYGLAYRFFELPLSLPTFFMNSVYPVMLSGKTQGLTKLSLVVKKALAVLLVSSLVLTGVSLLLSPAIVLVNEAFAASIGVFRILILSLPLFFVTSLLMWLLVALKKNKTLALIYGSVMMVNVVLNLIFIPNYGSFAAAIITVASEALVLMLTGYVAWREFNRGKSRIASRAVPRLW